MESFLTQWGYAALILFGFLEAACIPISSEITFGFAGVLAYEGHLNLLLVIILGTLAELAGSYASYAVGRIGGRPLVHKLGRYVLVTESDVSRAERFLEGRGMWAIPVGRMLPFVRAFTSIVAGLVRIPAGKFGILSLIGPLLSAAAPSWASSPTACARSGARISSSALLLTAPPPTPVPRPRSPVPAPRSPVPAPRSPVPAPRTSGRSRTRTGPASQAPRPARAPRSA